MQLLIVPITTFASSSSPRQHAIVHYLNDRQTVDEIAQLYNTNSGGLNVFDFVNRIIPHNICIAEITVITNDIIETVKAQHNIIGRTHYIDSETSDRVYEVLYRDEDGWTCTCPAHAYRPGYCKHIKQILDNPREFI